MVVQVTFLAEGLGAERAEDLQSQVLGSVVAVKVPPAEKNIIDRSHATKAPVVENLRDGRCK